MDLKEDAKCIYKDAHLGIVFNNSHILQLWTDKLLQTT